MEADDHQDDEIKESMSDVEDDKDGSKVSSKIPPYPSVRGAVAVSIVGRGRRLVYAASVIGTPFSSRP